MAGLAIYLWRRRKLIDQKAFVKKILVYILIFSMIYQSGSVPAALGLNTVIVMVTKIFLLLIMAYFCLHVRELKKSIFLLGIMLIGIIFSFILYKESIYHLLYKVVTFLLFFNMFCYTQKYDIKVEQVLYNILFGLNIIMVLLYIVVEIFHIDLIYSYSYTEGSYYYRNYFNLFFSCSSGQILPRLCGLFWEPGVCAIYLNVQLYLYFYSRQIERKKWKLIVNLIGLLLTQSAAGYCVMMIILFSLVYKNKYFNKSLKIGLSIFILLICIVVVIIKKNADINNLANYSYGLRVSDIYNGLSIYIRHPFFGTGYGNNTLFVANDRFGRGSSNGLISWMYMMGTYGMLFALCPFIMNIKCHRYDNQILWLIIVLIFNSCEPLYSLPLMQYVLAYEYYKMLKGKEMPSIKNITAKIKGNIVYRYTFGNYGKNSIIRHPLEINNRKQISIGNNVYVGEYAWIMARGNQDSDIKLIINDNTQIGHYVHIVASELIKIENDVLIADKVFISDCTHNYNDIDIAVLKQGISVLKPVSIGEGTWIGEGVCVCGADIGRHCVIGANSVVVNDIPDYCVAVGSPAKVIKRFNLLNNKWERVYENN